MDVKIALQITSPISTAKSSVSSANTSEPDFRSTLTAAVTSGGDRNSKTAKPEEPKKKTAQPPQQASAELAVAVTPQNKMLPAGAAQQTLLATNNSLIPAKEFSLDSKGQTDSSSSVSDSPLSTISRIQTALQMPLGNASDLEPEVPIEPASAKSDLSELANNSTTSAAQKGKQDESKILSGGPTPVQSVEGPKLPTELTSSLMSESGRQGAVELKATGNVHSTLAEAKEKPDAASAKDVSADSAPTPKTTLNHDANREASVALGGASAISNGGIADADGPASQLAAMLQSQSSVESPLPIASSGNGLHAAPSLNFTKATDQNTNPAVKDSLTAKAASSSKAKPVTDLGAKFSTNADSSTEGQSAVTNGPDGPKVVETTPTVTTSASSSEASVDANLVQQLAQATPVAVSDHVQPAAQSVVAMSPDPVHNQLPTTGASSALQSVPSLNSAQLIQSMHHSEMRLGLQSEEFGNISISTSINHQALSAQISTDHSELSRALAMHLPSMEEKLGSTYGVQARVEVRDGAGAGASSYSNSGQQSKDSRESRRETTASTTASVERMASLTSSTAGPIVSSGPRLDIRI